jgi:hypothetical protein
MTDDNLSSERYAQLAALAQKLEDDGRFMAYVLRLYREQGKLTEQELVKHLDTTPEMLVRLALCRRPDKRSPQFTSQLQQLAIYTEIDVDLLETLIQRVSD